MPHTPDDIVLIDKPKGVTSFDVIRHLRKELGIKKIGHAGTLDPLATGLLIVGVDGGTKKLKEYIWLPKEYVAEVLIGERRTTGDMEGEVVEEADVSTLDEGQVRGELRDMIGIFTLPVSPYSAVKKGGVPMYRRARAAEKRGEEVKEKPMRDMEVMEAELLGIESITINRNKRTEDRLSDQYKNSLVTRTNKDTGPNKCVIKVRFFVGSGTYIRSLAEELGGRLGYPATLQNLRRTRVGKFSIAKAQRLNM